MVVKTVVGQNEMHCDNCRVTCCTVKLVIYRRCTGYVERIERGRILIISDYFNLTVKELKCAILSQKMLQRVPLKQAR
jgi:hypothetical protein